MYINSYVIFFLLNVVLPLSSQCSTMNILICLTLRRLDQDIKTIKLYKRKKDKM